MDRKIAAKLVAEGREPFASIGASEHWQPATLCPYIHGTADRLSQRRNHA